MSEILENDEKDSFDGDKILTDYDSMTKDDVINLLGNNKNKLYIWEIVINFNYNF